MYWMIVLTSTRWCLVIYDVEEDSPRKKSIFPKHNQAVFALIYFSPLCLVKKLQGGPLEWHIVPRKTSLRALASDGQVQSLAIALIFG